MPVANKQPVGSVMGNRTVYLTNDSRPDVQQIGEGDRVRIDIPDETDPDHDLHGEHGKVVTVIRDDAADVTGVDADSQLYRVQLDSGRTVDVRGRDVRPPIDD